MGVKASEQVSSRRITSCSVVYDIVLEFVDLEICFVCKCEGFIAMNVKYLTAEEEKVCVCGGGGLMVERKKER